MKIMILKHWWFY